MGNEVVVHMWWMELEDSKDLMRCGFVIHFDDVDVISTGHDFVVPPHVDKVTCPQCRKAIGEQAKTAVRSFR